MTETSVILWTGLALVGLGCSALWSGLESALYGVNPVALRGGRAEGDRGVRRVARELARPDRALTTILIGNNTANYLGTLGLSELLNGMNLALWAQVVIQMAVLSPVLLVFGEAVPKDLMRRSPLRWAKALSPALVVTRLLATVCGVLPLVLGVATLLKRALRVSREAPVVEGRERLLAYFRESVGKGGVTEAQVTLADRALALERAHATSVMTPWFLAGAIDVSWKARRAATMLGELGARRGVAVDAVGRVVGAVDAITLLADPSSVVADRLEPVGELADGITIRDALVILSHNGAKIGVVVDSGGSPIGVVTIEDLLAPLIRSGDKE